MLLIVKSYTSASFKTEVTGRISFNLYFCSVPVSLRWLQQAPASFSRLRVSVLLPGESSVQWKRIGSDIWQFDKVDLVS